MEELFDSIVIGGGIEGSWTALHLALKGQRTLLVEQFPLPHTRGSSHGQSRIIRRIYKERFQALLMNDAYQQWQWLENESGTSLLKKTPGAVFFAGEAYFGQLEKMEETLKLVQAQYVKVNTGEFCEKFPGFHLDTNEAVQGLIDLDAAILRADRCLIAVQNTFRKSGGTVKDSHQVTNIRVNLDGTVTVSGNGFAYQGRKVVVCAGAWASGLLALLNLNPPLQPLKMAVLYFSKKPVPKDVPKLRFTDYIFYDLNSKVYGLPNLEYPSCMKVCLDDGLPCDPNHRDAGDNSQYIKDTTQYVAKYLKDLDPNPSINETCMYTMTPDAVAILDTHPTYSNIAFGCGLSGSGFKMGPVFGEYLASLALNQPANHDFTKFKLSRFTN